MANIEHVEIVRRGSEAIRKWRDGHPNTPLDLVTADLAGIELNESEIIAP